MDVTAIEDATVRLHWTDEPYPWLSTKDFKPPNPARQWGAELTTPGGSRATAGPPGESAQSSVTVTYTGMLPRVALE